MKNIKEEVLKEVLYKHKTHKKDVEKAIDLTLTEVGKVIDECEIMEDIEEGDEPLQKKELKKEIGIK